VNVVFGSAVSPALLSAVILGGALLLFVSEKVRHDLVALIALFACLATGLTTPAKAFAGLADPAVIAVAAILVVGRAIELSGVAGMIARVAIPAQAGFTFRMAALLAVAAILSAFMNNIAALVITMPIATEIARDAKMPPGATLMPLAFATILGGMTTLIGTPANLILSSVREDELGAPFAFFAMSPVGASVAAVGLAYLALVGWRLLPRRGSLEQSGKPPWRVFELSPDQTLQPMSFTSVKRALRAAPARLLAVFRHGERTRVTDDMKLEAGDRLLVLSRENQWVAADRAALSVDATPITTPGAVTARTVVAHGSFLIGLGHEAIENRSEGRLSVVAVGPHTARQRAPLAQLRIQSGDQLYLRGRPDALARFIPKARLLEVDRLDPAPVARRGAIVTVAIFAVAIIAIVTGAAPPALAFLGAAIVLAASRLVPADETYRAIDWSVIVLLAAMIPVGRSFEESGAAAIAAKLIGEALAGLPLFAVLAAICSVSMLLSIFLNNVATAIIMGPLAIDLAHRLGVNPDAALLAVLIGVSSDFLTPIGHQNNMLVMGPGGYRFTDYARMGAVLVILVVVTSAGVLTLRYG
jgi:di/tricarboxylate transporter